MAGAARACDEAIALGVIRHEFGEAVAEARRLHRLDMVAGEIARLTGEIEFLVKLDAPAQGRTAEIPRRAEDAGALLRADRAGAGQIALQQRFHLGIVER